MRKRIEKELLERMHRDPGNWRGPFYDNRKDPRLIVPKLRPLGFGLGWTFNFASPYTYVFIILVLAIIIASQYFLK